MIVGVDATCCANGRGYGRFARELLRTMAAEAPRDQFVWFVDAGGAPVELPRVGNVRVVGVPQRVAPTTAASASGNRSVRDMLRLTRAVSRERLDVFFSPSVYTYFPLPPSLPAVVTVHDAIAERFPDLTLPTWRARAFWHSKVRLALWQARLVLTVSEFAANELADVLRVRRERLRVALEAPAAAYVPSLSRHDIERVRARVGLPADSRWFVYVGGFNPHKSVDTLIRAHARAARTVSPAPHLVLVGALSGDVFHGDRGRLREEIARCGTDPLVHWAGFLPDEELRHLHSGALALVLPSLCEGFGLPAVEAAACGTPVVATTASPLPELLAGGGLFVPPGNDDGLTAALTQMLADEPGRRLMGATARAQARRLDWSRGARAALTALREAAA